MPQIITFHPQNPLPDSQINELTVLSRVILRGFEIDNSPLCTDAPTKAEGISQSERSYYWQLRSDWLMFFRLRNENCKIAKGGLVCTVFRPTHFALAWGGSGEIWARLVIYLNCNTVSRRLMIDLFSPHYVSTADDERMSEIEQAFQVVRGGQLHWFFAWILQLYRLLTHPKLGGERRLEAEEIRRSSGGFRLRRSWKLYALFFFFLCAHTLCSLCNIFLSMYEIFS